MRGRSAPPFSLSPSSSHSPLSINPASVPSATHLVMGVLCSDEATTRNTELGAGTHWSANWVHTPKNIKEFNTTVPFSTASTRSIWQRVTVAGLSIRVAHNDGFFYFFHRYAHVPWGSPSSNRVGGVRSPFRLGRQSLVS